MIAVWIAVYVLAALGTGGLLLVAVVALLLARDMRRMRRERLDREGKPLNARERRELARLEREVNSSGGGS